MSGDLTVGQDQHVAQFLSVYIITILLSTLDVLSSVVHKLPVHKPIQRKILHPHHVLKRKGTKDEDKINLHSVFQ